MFMHRWDGIVVRRWILLFVISFFIAYGVDQYYFFKEGSCFVNNSIININEMLKKIAGK